MPTPSSVSSPKPPRRIAAASVLTMESLPAPVSTRMLELPLTVTVSAPPDRRSVGRFEKVAVSTVVAPLVTVTVPALAVVVVIATVSPLKPLRSSTSLPPPPSTVSVPPPGAKVSAPVEPLKESLPAVPMIAAKPLTLSLPPLDFTTVPMAPLISAVTLPERRE